MQIEVVSESSFARKITVTVPAADVKAALDKAYRTVGQRARIPGFRQGKVPRNVLESRYGASIAEDVAGELIQQSWTRAMTDHAITPVSRPSVVEQGQVTAAADFAFVIGVEVKPEVAATSYTGLSVYWPKAEVADGDVERELERRRMSQSRLMAITDRPAQVGDVVQTEITVRDGDTVVLTEPGVLLRTRSEQWFAGIESFLVGASVDEEKAGDVTFTETARHDALKGRTLAVTAKVLGIQAMQAPELDDALAKELGHDTVDALKDATRTQLAKGRDEMARNQARANLLEALIAANPFDVPAGMVEQNLQLLVEELKLQQAYQGVDPRTIRFNQAQMADLRNRAGFAARGGILLESVWKTESLAVTDADVDAKIAELAEQRGQTSDAIRGWLDKDGGVEDLRQRLLEEKTLDWLLDRANVSHEAPAAPAAEGEAPAAEAAPAEAPAAEEAPAPKKKRATKKKAAAEDEPAAE